MRRYDTDGDASLVLDSDGWLVEYDDVETLANAARVILREFDCGRTPLASDIAALRNALGGVLPTAQGESYR